MTEDYSRRDFLAGVTGAIATCAVGVGRDAGSAPKEPGSEDLPTTRIRKVYLAKPVPSWPKPDLDVPAEIRRIDERLAALADRMPGIRMEGGELYRVPQDVPSSAAALSNPDGIVVFNLTSKVADAQKLLNGYEGGLHRVIFYGDRMRSIQDLAGLMRYRVVEEC